MRLREYPLSRNAAYFLADLNLGAAIRTTPILAAGKAFQIVVAELYSLALGRLQQLLWCAAVTSLIHYLLGKLLKSIFVISFLYSTHIHSMNRGRVVVLLILGHMIAAFLNKTH